MLRGVRWLSDKGSDSGARGRGFQTYFHRVVSLSNTLYSPYLGSVSSNPDMTEQLLTGTLDI